MSQEAKLSKSNQTKNVWAASLSNVMSGYNLNIINVVVVILGELYVCSIPCVEMLFMSIQCWFTMNLSRVQKLSLLRWKESCPLPLSSAASLDSSLLDSLGTGSDERRAFCCAIFWPFSVALDGIEFTKMTQYYSAFAYTFWNIPFIYQIIFWRTILGIGNGGVYPLSAVMSSESTDEGQKESVGAFVYCINGVGWVYLALCRMIYRWSLLWLLGVC